MKKGSKKYYIIFVRHEKKFIKSTAVRILYFMRNYDFTDHSLSNEISKLMPLDELLMIGLRRREGVHLEELAKNAGWSQKECDKNIELLEKFWLDFLKDGSLIRNNGRYFFSDPKGMQISNQILIQMFLWWDSLDRDQ